MKKSVYSLALAGVLSLGMASAAFAQDNSTPPDQGPGPGPSTMQGNGGRRMDPNQQLKRMTKQLDLTEDQQAQIRPILQNRALRMQQLFQDQSMDPQDRRSKLRAVQDDSRHRIESVLNETQKAKYAEMQQQMHERRQGGGGDDAGAPPPQPQF
jgi:periplasmic protein CpxP/Spy